MISETNEVTVPPDIFKALTDVAEFKLSDPAVAVSVPVPLTPPFKFALPVPETVNPPLKDMAPDTVNEPPETLSEFELLIVSAAMVSVPELCVTAKPELRSTASVKLGNTPLLQLPGVAQSKPPLALVKVSVLVPVE